MRGHVALFGLLLTLTTANLASAGVLSDSKPDQKALAMRALANPSGAVAKELQPLFQMLEAEVRSELVQEAGQGTDGNGDFEAYLIEDKPFDLMIVELESPKISKMDRADLLITMIKAGIRYQFLSTARFMREGPLGQRFLANEAKFKVQIHKLKTKLGISQ